MDQLTEIVACPAPLLRGKVIKKEFQNKTFEFPIGRGGSLKFESVGCYIPERENGKPIVETSKTEMNPGFRNDYIGLGILMSEADVIRTAAELHEHVTGTREIEGVLAWTDDQVCCFPLDWPPDENDEEAGRFCRLWSDPSDLSIISFEEARDKQKTGQFVCIGQVPRLRELPSAVASGKSADDGADYVLTFIEFCCSKGSKASDVRYDRPRTRLIRITEEDDPTSPEGLKRLLDIIEDPKSGHVVVMSSIPCTLGCTFQRVNNGRKCMDNPETYKKYLELQASHQIRFDGLMTALEAVVEALLRVGGDLIREWGA